MTSMENALIIPHCVPVSASHKESYLTTANASMDAFLLLLYNKPDGLIYGFDKHFIWILDSMLYLYHYCTVFCVLYCVHTIMVSGGWLIVFIFSLQYYIFLMARLKISH